MPQQRQVARVRLEVRLEPLRVQQLQPQLLRPRLLYQYINCAVPPMP
jgi:hypothetical protein